MGDYGFGRCRVCGRKYSAHKSGRWAVCAKMGRKWKPVTPVYIGSKCGAVQTFQNHLLAGMGTLRRLGDAESLPRI